MFAFAIWDAKEKELFAARDRFGEKPFFYYFDKNQFLFASEMKAIMAIGIPNEIDKSSLQTYFHLNYIPSPYSIFKNIVKLEAGCDMKKNSQGTYAIKVYN